MKKLLIYYIEANNKQQVDQLILTLWQLVQVSAGWLGGHAGDVDGTG